MALRRIPLRNAHDIEPSAADAIRQPHGDRAARATLHQVPAPDAHGAEHPTAQTTGAPALAARPPAHPMTPRHIPMLDACGIEDPAASAAQRQAPRP